MDPLISTFNSSLNNIVYRLKDDLKTIRTGRASPSMVEGLIVETYGGQTELKLLELAAIASEGPTVISIAPFDPSVIQDIEKAILKSPLGLSPQLQGNKILVRFPLLSQEQREKFRRLLAQTIEEKKLMIRNERDEIRKKIKLQFEQKILSEDNKFRLEKEIDNITHKYSIEIQQIRESKEREIMEV